MDRKRDYYSWSQYESWSASPRAFYRKYVVGDDDHEDKYRWKGKQLMKAIEFGYDTVEDADPTLPLILHKLPTLEIIEDRIVVDFPMTESYKIPIISYVDSGTKFGDVFFEYKTGKNPWTQEMAEKKDSQMCFYSTMYYLKNGTIPKCVLYWIETYEKENGTVFYTGEIEAFEVTFTKANINAMIKRIRKSLIDIEEFEYEEAELNKELVRKYVKVRKKMDKLKFKLEDLGNQIYNELKETNFRYGSTEQGFFSLRKSTTWLYSKEVGKLKDKVKKLTKEEIDNGTAVESVSESLLFKPVKEL